MLTASQGSHVPINFLSKAHPTKLKLIQGDPDTFSDVLTLINEYEGEFRPRPRPVIPDNHTLIDQRAKASLLDMKAWLRTWVQSSRVRAFSRQ